MGRTTIAVGMIGSSARAALWLALWALTLGAAVATRHSFAQQPATDAAPTLSADALADLVGPIALYPDDLVGIVLPASTYPLQVVQAARFLDERAKNASLKPSDVWDDSVVALLNYPEVVKLMNDDLDWTWKLGDAVINQRADVLDAIQGFRARAAAAGNLRSDDRQVVANDDGAIAIKPADPEVIYVPYYEPERVVVYQSAPVYHYYPYAYPVYYYPYPYGYAFSSGFFWGVTSAYLIGWNTHYVNVYHCGYYGHPYYGHQYNNAYYVRHDANVSMSRGSYVWQPHYRRGAQPFTRSDGQRYVGTRGDQGAGTSQGSYRGGTVNRSGGQQQHQPLDPSAAASRDRAVPGVSPRADGSGGTYRSNGSSGTARTIPQRDGAALGGTTPSGRQQNQPIRNRDASQSYRSTAPAITEPQVREAAPQQGNAPAARTPGQYRSSGGMSQALRQSQSRMAAPSVRVAPPSTERSSAPPRSGNGGGSVYRTERSAPPQPQSDNSDSSPGGYSGGDSRGAPTYRGGGGEGRSSGGRNTNQPVRGR